MGRQTPAKMGGEPNLEAMTVQIFRDLRGRADGRLNQRGDPLGAGSGRIHFAIEGAIGRLGGEHDTCRRNGHQGPSSTLEEASGCHA